MSTQTTAQLFHFDVNVITDSTGYSAQISGVGHDFDEAWNNAVEQERSAVAQDGDHLVFVSLV